MARNKKTKEQESKKATSKTRKPPLAKKVVKKKTSVKGKDSTSGSNKSSDKKLGKIKVLTQKKTIKRSGKAAANMDELLKRTGYEFNVPQQGKVVEGVVTEVSKRMILVDIGAKTEGLVVDRELEAAYELVKDLSVGDKLKAIVVSPENDRGQILLSLKREASTRAWEHYRELMETEAVLKVRGLEVNKGGLIVRANGMRGFVPSSQFGKAWAGRLDELINRPIKVRVIEVDKEKNRLIFSERHVSEADILEKKADALKVIKKGDVYEGVISGVMPFGAFVTVRVPLTRDKKASKQDDKKKKAKTEDQKPKDGEVVEVDGLVHISEISWEKVNDPNDYFKTGDKVKVKVMSVDNDSGKLNLSVKQLSDDPWKDIQKRYKPGSKHRGEVTRVEPFGAFVNFEPGVDGLIHISKIPAGEEPEVGKKLDVYVETVDSEQRRMSLSMVLKTTEKLIYK